ncbi:MAG: YcgN family cysteine cluster protein [Pseudomonadales bacterium]|nr:YcgN family cysteine cluster protein [Pseudomonadales bacterium]
MTAFWETKALAELDAEEWERLCDRCGRCCLLKLEDTASGQVAYTAVACKLLDIERVRCTDYARRRQRVADCLALDADLAAAIAWLPATCAYRLRAEGKPLPDWHPLVSGDPRSVRAAGISIAGRVVSERFVHPAALVEHIIRWVE